LNSVVRILISQLRSQIENLSKERTSRKTQTDPSRTSKRRGELPQSAGANCHKAPGRIATLDEEFLHVIRTGAAAF
jgi:hypothetical protein